MRTTLLGAAVVVVAALTGCGEQGAAPEPATAPLGRTPATADSPAPEGSLVLGPDGVGSLRLGMNHHDLTATGLAYSAPGSRHDGWRPGCRVLHYRSARLGRIPGDTTAGSVSLHQGLERMYATRRMATPDGIRLGSTIDEVRTAYDRPNLTRGELLTVAASRRAVYRIQLSAVVSSISLELRDLACTI
jgi:hypothetical protein